MKRPPHWTSAAKPSSILIMTRTLCFTAIIACAVSSTAPAQATAKKAQTARTVTVKLSDATGKSIGIARLSPAANGVKIALAVHSLAPGEHGIHVHENAKCEGPDFKSAGGHFNPDHKSHGKDNPQGPHAGDMPNFTVDAKGNSHATVVATGVTLDSGPHSVFTNGGTALVIHEKADDMKSDPAGNAGNRIACGVITK